jgi:uncharacterized protein
MPRLSRYNHFQPWANGDYLAFNARTGAVALMTKENYHVYCRLVDKLESGDASLSDEEKTLLTQLQYGQFVYPDDSDERVALRFRHNLDRYNQSALGLVLAPTMACNMACEYCYESKTNARMSPSVTEAVITFAESQAPHLRSLSVAWYGGEPLLAMDIIEDLSETFLDLSREHEIEYRSTIITNGYLLDRRAVDKLAAWKVGGAQITLDGPSRLHNQKRPLVNGRPSFDTIVENIDYAATKMAVTVRVNVDKTYTTEIIEEFLDELAQAGLQKKVRVYFGQLEPSTQVCSNIAESCYDTANFAQVETEYFRLLLEKGFLIERLPTPISTQCMAQTVNSFIVDPEGFLYRCYNHVGDRSQSMGTISEPIDYLHWNFMRLFQFDPFEDKQCYECNILPICMGGCPARRVDRGMEGEQMCDSWKHNLQPMLEIIARAKQQERQQAVTAKEQT